MVGEGAAVDAWDRIGDIRLQPLRQPAVLVLLARPVLGGAPWIFLLLRAGDAPLVLVARVVEEVREEVSMGS